MVIISVIYIFIFFVMVVMMIIRGVHEQHGRKVGASAEGQRSNPLLQVGIQTPYLLHICKHQQKTLTRHFSGLEMGAPCCVPLSESSFAVRQWPRLGCKTFPHCMKEDFPRCVQCLGADQQGGEPGGCEGQGGEGHVLRREDEDGALCRRAQNCSHLVQVCLTPIWNQHFLLENS